MADNTSPDSNRRYLYLWKWLYFKWWYIKVGRFRVLPSHVVKVYMYT